MAVAYLSLGANIGDPQGQIEAALDALNAQADIDITSQSRILTTKAWGKTDQPDFKNMAVAIQTSLTPQELLDACLEIEQMLGRKRIEKWGPRLIDIDIIAYERLECETPSLVLPHPFAHERDFVLDPLREISPETADWLTGRLS